MQVLMKCTKRMDESTNRHNDNLGVNKMGKNIRKTKRDQPNYGKNNNSSMNGASSVKLSGVDKLLILQAKLDVSGYIHGRENKEPLLLLMQYTREKLVLLLQSGAGGGIYFIFSSRAHDCFRFLHHGSRYNKFCGYPLEIVNKMPKKELAEELLFVNAIRDNTIDPIKDETHLASSSRLARRSPHSVKKLLREPEVR
ncbi:hypothetical protein JHK84_027726 [Glycine max]|nr:hypothetical protein JHK84_027726 [Glycine max]